MLSYESVVFLNGFDGPYSKSFPVPTWGMVPRLSILFNAGGLPARGGGVVLPSKGCAARSLDFRQ